MVLEEAPPLAPRAPKDDARLFVLSAKSATALDQMTNNLADSLERKPDQSLSDVEWTLQVGRQTLATAAQLWSTITRKQLNCSVNPIVHR